EHRQQKADLVGAEAVDGEAHYLAKEHGSARTRQRAFERARFGGTGNRHLLNDWTSSSIAAVRPFLLTFLLSLLQATSLTRVPIGSMVMRIWSPLASVKESGGTIPVPVIRKQPCGKLLSR